MAKTNENTPTQGGEELAYEKVIEELDAVVERLEAGELGLEDSLKVFERGVQLANLAQKQLDEAERRVEVLLQSGKTEPLGTDAGEEDPFRDDVPF